MSALRSISEFLALRRNTSLLLIALVLAGTYLLFPTAIIGGNLAPYALFVTLFAVLVLVALPGVELGEVKAVTAGRLYKEITLIPTGFQSGMEEVLIVMEGVHQQVPDADPAKQPMKLLPAPESEPNAKDPTEGQQITDADKLKERYRRIGEAQPPLGKYLLCRKLMEYAKELGVERVFTFAAMATQMHPKNRARVFGAATDQESLEELKRLERMPEAAGEYGMIRSYLDWLTDLPWSMFSPERIDVAEAKRAAIAYLSSYIPAALPRKGAPKGR